MISFRIECKKCKSIKQTGHRIFKEKDIESLQSNFCVDCMESFDNDYKETKVFLPIIINEKREKININIQLNLF